MKSAEAVSPGETGGLPTLGFVVDDRYCSIRGSWASRLLAIGRQLSEVDTTGPLTLALSLPVLDFAGPLVAAGFVSGAVERCLRVPGGKELGMSVRDRLFKQLCELPVGAPLLLQQASGETVRAVFEGVQILGNEKWGVIRFQSIRKGSGKEFINVNKVSRVFFAKDASSETEERKLGRGVHIDMGLSQAFVHDVFGSRELMLHPTADCALIGTISSISTELDETAFFSRKSEGVVVGALQDVVRTSNLLPPGEAARSKIIAVAGESPRPGEYSPTVAIFVGSMGYIRKAGKFPDAHHVVLISPVDRSFEGGMHAINEAFLRRAGECPPIEWQIPDGASAMAFARGRANMQ